MTNQTIKVLLKEGFKEIAKESLRWRDYDEVIEYWDSKTWRVFAKKEKTK